MKFNEDQKSLIKTIGTLPLQGGGKVGMGSGSCLRKITHPHLCALLEGQESIHSTQAYGYL
jgi:hypothetical protein